MPLSGAYSSTRELRLQIADSRLRCLLWWGFASLVTGTLWLLIYRGYPGLALVALLPTAGSLLKLYRASDCGLWLYCRAGEWSLEAGSEPQRQQLVGGSLFLSWVAYLALQSPLTGQRRHIWVYRDSVGADDYRRLRKCIRLYQQ